MRRWNGETGTALVTETAGSALAASHQYEEQATSRRWRVASPAKLGPPFTDRVVDPGAGWRHTWCGKSAPPRSSC
ncbi:hypothetical protein Micbo1qcDRAFT_159130 [Microdochium bolleyi]|uniref:Uncharacterized protein n=1 Tax=Microdochium bolleyi TaxID=196109 RepID=A0A136JAC3_9PEZI|nr:hypothetical protein Micbo1qcDRAFT_159130 [Microdochium bolleyi]